VCLHAPRCFYCPLLCLPSDKFSQCFSSDKPERGRARHGLSPWILLTQSHLLLGAPALPGILLTALDERGRGALFAHHGACCSACYLIHQLSCHSQVNSYDRKRLRRHFATSTFPSGYAIEVKWLPRGTGVNNVRWLLKGEYHAIKDTRIRDRSPAGPGFACVRTKWWFVRRFVRKFGQHRLKRRDLWRARNLNQHTSKLSSKRHRTNTGPNTRSIV